MTRWIRALTLFVLLVCLGLWPVSRSASTSVARPAIHAPTPEARLRRVHLVRPDLIQYPIEYQVIC